MPAAGICVGPITSVYRPTKSCYCYIPGSHDHRPSTLYSPVFLREHPQAALSITHWNYPWGIHEPAVKIRLETIFRRFKKNTPGLGGNTNPCRILGGAYSRLRYWRSGTIGLLRVAIRGGEVRRRNIVQQTWGIGPMLCLLGGHTFCLAKPQCSNCLLVKQTATAFWHCRTV